jgi:hypothetical protein
MMIASGQVQHRFHGRYSMAVGLEFASSEHAQAAMEFLPGFAPLDGHPKVLWRLAQGREDLAPVSTRSEVDEVKELLEKFRVYERGDRHEPIDSCNTSIDFGPRFHIDLTQAIRDREFARVQLQLPYPT